MKNIFKIFRTDLRGLFKNFFALVVCIGICLLPALYAWFNIYANWDPYSNTGNLEIAVANEDVGYTDESGKRWNLGEQVVTDLKENDSINWKFLSSGKKAMEGVEAGDYYAAIVLDEDFSKNMATGITEGAKQSIITYYTNDKKNAVAIKITDTAVDSVKASIDTQYVKQLYKQFISTTGSIFKDKDIEGTADQIVARMEDISSMLQDTKKMIQSLQSSNAKLQTVLANSSETLTNGIILFNSGAENLGEGSEALESARELLLEYQTSLSGTVSDVQDSLTDLSAEIKAAENEQDPQVLENRIEQIQEDSDTVSEKLTVLASAVGEMKTGDETADAEASESEKNLLAARDRIETAMEESGLETYTADETTLEDTKESLEAVRSSVDSAGLSIGVDVMPEISNLLLRLQAMLQSAQTLMKDLSNVLSAMDNTLESTNQTINVANAGLDSLLTILDDCRKRIDDWIVNYKNSTIPEKLSQITGFLGGNPDTLGTYLSAPVTVNENKVYEITTYGSGVSPFYTALAIWVGMTILASVLSPHAKRKGLENPQEHQLYFGRYLLFLFLSLLQTIVIILGDLYLLKIQCLYPFHFLLAAVAASVTFSLIVYSLAISFGDVGKAAAIVILVIQIAGSGGTYPIEALPAFYQSMYKFFPFPYVINAMRECIGGMYGNTYWKCMGVLGIFCVAALLIGLVVRIPMIGLNAFVEKRLEDTRLM